MRRLPPEYRHEPRLALAAGRDGLDLVRRILAAARAYLTSDGMLACEVGAARTAVERAYPRLPFSWPAVTHPAGGVFLIERAQLPADLE
jgi:ribosomal protein L3 glutamine methyltransferase